MKIVNVVLAIGTLFILGALIVLGIKTFYPEPQYPSSLSYPMVPSPVAPCIAGDTKCILQNSSTAAQYQAEQDAYTQQQQAYTDAMNIYNRNLFIIANVVGIIVFVIGFFLVLYAGLASQGVPIGIMMAGLWSIIYGYFSGWGSIDDSLKFVVGLIVAVLVIGGSMWLMQRHEGKHAK